MVGGSVANFVERMNARAQELGCEGTHFANAHGYHDENHYSTAQDLAIIASELLKYDEARQIVATPSYTIKLVRNGQEVDLPSPTAIVCSAKAPPITSPIVSVSKPAPTAGPESASSARRRRMA